MLLVRWPARTIAASRMDQSLQKLLALITALTGIAVIFPALDQWKAKRERSKIKEDLEILQKLKEAQEQSATGTQLLTNSDLEQLQLAASSVCKKIQQKTKRMITFGRERTDLDASAVIIGVALLSVGW